MENKKNVHEVEVKIEAEEFEEAIKKAYDKKKKDIKLDGFRKGNVPFDIYVKKNGKESLYMDAVDIIYPNAYFKALESDNLIPIIEPKVDLKSIDENGVVFKFVITTRPDVTVKKYKGLKVTKESDKVTDEEVEEEINHMLERYSELEIKNDGVIENGNVAIIDFEGFNNGVAFEGGKGENYPLTIGSNTFIPGFEEQLIGMKKEEEKDIKVTFPKEYPSEELKGREVVFKVKVHEIKERVKREFDEEFFEDLAIDGVTNKEELEKEVRKNLEVNKTKEVEDAYTDELLKKIEEQTEVDIPEELIHEEIHHLLHHYEEQLRMQGISLDVYLEMTRTTREDFEKQMEPTAISHIKTRFALDTIKDKENIVVDEKEVDEELEKEAKKYNISADEFIKAYGSREMFKYELEIKKLIDFLKENNK